MADFRWLDAAACDPPHRVTHAEKFDAIAASLAASGWKPDEPVLLGYEREGRVQLITGSHRHAAARALRLPLPVLIRHDVDALWGTDGWVRMIAQPPRLQEIHMLRVYLSLDPPIGPSTQANGAYVSVYDLREQRHLCPIDDNHTADGQWVWDHAHHFVTLFGPQNTVICERPAR